jgi:protein phosphatase
LVVQINRAVLDAARLDRRYRGMGTTLTLAALVDMELVVVHVGDSRAYVASGGQIRQLTEDHSLVQTLVSAGTITEEEAMRHHSRNVITSAIGVEGDFRIDVVRTEVRPADVVVVCTDGLSSLVTGKEILALITEATRSSARDDSPQVVADMLVSLALERGGYDNVTAIVGRVEP